jgi:hypothetical protein
MAMLYINALLIISIPLIIGIGVINIKPSNQGASINEFNIIISFFGYQATALYKLFYSHSHSYFIVFFIYWTLIAVVGLIITISGSVFSKKAQVYDNVIFLSFFPVCFNYLFELHMELIVGTCLVITALSIPGGYIAAKVVKTLRRPVS